MTDTQKQGEIAALVHWTYSREEWKRFIRWTKLKKGLLAYFIHVLSPGSNQPALEVKITPERVWIGDEHRPFRTNEHQLKKIDIRSEGKMNVMEITYERTGGKSQGPDEIRVLIPKGKLREAIGLQDSLQNT